MEAVARLRHYRGSAQKVRLVADLIRMKPVGRALAMLRATPKGCAPDLKKLLESAVANAQQNGSGVDAPAVRPTVVTPSSQVGAIPAASSTRRARRPAAS